MRTLMLLLTVVLSTTIVEAKKDVEVGDWVSFKGTTMMGPQAMEMTQKYAIVGQEKDADGTPLLWFETDINMPGVRVLMKLLVPAIVFEQEAIDSPEFYKTVRRGIMKMGDQPAVEFPVEQTMGQLQALRGLADDPNAKVTEMGEEVLEAPKGRLRCVKKRYQGKASMEQAQGPMVMTITTTYDRMIWHSDAVPLVGYAKIEVNTLVEVSTLVPVPGAPPSQPQETHSQMDLIDFGQGAKSAITEEPVQAPVPTPGK